MDKRSAGRIDLHSHLVPGVDDGCKSFAESIQCVRLLKEHGYIGTACTVHMGPDWFPDNTPAKIAKAVAELDEQLRREGLDYRIWAGGELRIAKDTVRWIEDVGIPTLGSGSCVLADYWGSTWPSFADELLQYLIAQGYQPILAHPERIDLREEDFDALLRSLDQMGVWLQGNFNSVIGGEGPQAERRVRRLLDEDRYYLMATDMHGPDSLESRLEALPFLEAGAGAEKLSTFLEKRPREIFQ